ncbi:Uncharacterised protein [Mycobacteroides abscessus subsp. abscessus]|nr:Uncharacterised protein [Mycobacteroides abscessus subsp. abscessus]
MNPGGEHRIDEARGVADENHAVSPELGIGIRIVLADSDLAVGALGDAGGVGQHVLHDLAAIDVVQQRLFLCVENVLCLVARDHGTDTGQRVR